MDSEKLIVKNRGQIQELYYSDVTSQTWTRKMLLNYMLQFQAYFNIISVIVLVAIYLFMMVSFFAGSLILAALGMVVASCMKYQLTFGQLYILSVYSSTFPLLIKMVLRRLHYEVPFFWVISMGISLFYISRAIDRLRQQKIQKPLEFM